MDDSGIFLPQSKEPEKSKPLHIEKQEVVRLDGPYRGTLEKQVAGALKNCIHAHGPITLDTLSSATKRIIAVIKNHNREVRKNVKDGRPRPLAVSRFRKAHRHGDAAGQ